MAGIILFTLGLLSLAHGQEVIVATAPPIAILPPVRRCQPPDLKCASSFKNTGECVDMATVDVGNLPDLYNLSAGSIDNICGPRISTFPPRADCCRCLSKASCSHPRCVPSGSRDRRCFQPARDIKRPGWFKVGVCDKKTNCDCLELCKNKRCDQAQGKCLLPEDPKPEGWTRAFMCNKRRKCSCFVPPCIETNRCTTAGGQCFKRGSAPPGSTFVGSFCNSRAGCYCYKPPVEDCEQTPECEAAINEGACYGPGDPVPVGAVGVPGVCKDECKCYGKGCSPTRDCLAGGGKCYRKGSEPTGSVMTDNTCDPNNDCYCYKQPVQDCDQTEECADAINGGKCYGPGDPVPVGAVGVPGVCKEDCKCYGLSIIGVECPLTKDCFIGGGKCYKRGTEPEGSENIDSECDPNNDCYCFKPLACRQTEKCQTAVPGGRCYGPGDLLPAGAVGVPDVCEDGCKCYGFKIISTFG